jgi:predicted amidohydrolase
MTPLPRTFSVGFLQFDVQLGNIGANLSKVEKGLKELAPDSPAIIIMPEMWATGFDYGNLPDLAGRAPEVLAILAQLADRYDIFLAGSLPEQDTAPNIIYNTLFVTGPDGVIGRYRKQHLFAPIDEDQHLTPGDNQLHIDTPLGKIAGLVCYDLRFPETLRAQTARGANLLLVSAQWPLVRIDHWRTLLMARAIENQIFVVAANRNGADSVAGGTIYGGHSLIVAPNGEILYEAGEDEEHACVPIDSADVEEVRARFNTAAPLPIIEVASSQLKKKKTQHGGKL